MIVKITVGKIIKAEVRWKIYAHNECLSQQKPNGPMPYWLLMLPFMIVNPTAISVLT